jgi:hypothetical protein
MIIMLVPVCCEKNRAENVARALYGTVAMLYAVDIAEFTVQYLHVQFPLGSMEGDVAFSLQTVYCSVLKQIDAPDLRDDLHLNVLDWYAQNVGLEESVDIYDVSTRRAEKLCGVSGDGDFITSVAWNEQVS